MNEEEMFNILSDTLYDVNANYQNEKNITVKKEYFDIVNWLINEYNSQQQELQLKDKTIENMAVYISTLDIEEDICNKTGKELTECDSMEFGVCENCIKHFFESKGE